MGIVVIFFVIALLAVYSFFRALKNRNILGLIFSGGAVLAFGFFAIMTVLNSGFPKLH